MGHSESPIDAHKDADSGARQAPIALRLKILILGCARYLSKKDGRTWRYLVVSVFRPKVFVLNLRRAHLLSFTLVKYLFVQSCLVEVGSQLVFLYDL